MFKVCKNGFTNGAYFSSLEQLTLELNDYFNWINHIQIRGTKGLPNTCRIQETGLIKVFLFGVAIPDYISISGRIETRLPIDTVPKIK